MIKKSFLFSYILICMVVTVQAQEKKSWAHRTTNTVKQRLDSALFRKVDTSYIEIPQKPWRVILRPKVDQLHTTMNSTFDADLLAKLSETWLVDVTSANISWDMRINQPLTTAVGVWVGYRGLGIGYSQSLTKHVGRHFTLSSTGSHYGLTFTYRRFSADDLTVKMRGVAAGGETYEIKENYKSYAPFWVRSIFLDGYYVFSGRRYSQAAAYNQSVIQRRSAGSFLLGLSWYQSSIDFSDRLNGEFIIAANDIGKIQVHQGNIGFGYGYNWVPLRNWLVNVMVMPTVSVYNRVRVTQYASNYDFASYEESEDVLRTYGEWDSEKHQWANGEQEKPMHGDIYNLVEEDLSWQKDVEVWETGTETKNTRWRVNINARAGITYFGKNWFASVNGQLHRFSYKHNETGVKLYDWYIRGAFGMRF